jgi:hypothetical protein
MTLTSYNGELIGRKGNVLTNVIQLFRPCGQASIVHRRLHSRIDRHPEHAAMIDEFRLIGTTRNADQDGDANYTIGVNCTIELDQAVIKVHPWLTVWVPHGRDEPHLWRLERVFCRERKPSLEEPSFTGSGINKSYR